jgi:hypothetical protein
LPPQLNFLSNYLTSPPALTLTFSGLLQSALLPCLCVLPQWTGFSPCCTSSLWSHG